MSSSSPVQMQMTVSHEQPQNLSQSQSIQVPKRQEKSIKKQAAKPASISRYLFSIQRPRSMKDLGQLKSTANPQHLSTFNKKLNSTSDQLTKQKSNPFLEAKFKYLVKSSSKTSIFQTMVQKQAEEGLANGDQPTTFRVLRKCNLKLKGKLSIDVGS